MSRDHFIRKFGKQGRFSTVPLEMIHEAFDKLDQDGDGNNQTYVLALVPFRQCLTYRVRGSA